MDMALCERVISEDSQVMLLQQTWGFLRDQTSMRSLDPSMFGCRSPPRGGCEIDQSALRLRYTKWECTL